jgi:glycosyltransferase involved in cell wall biosynthesis
MRVAVDGRALRPGATHQRGVARYLRCLLEALAEAGPDDEYAVVVAGAGDPDPFRGANVRLVRSRVPGRLLFGAAALAGRPRLDRLAGGCDVAWAPALAPIAMSRGVPLVLTLHDLSFEHAADFSRYERVWHRLARPRELARRAERVICPSVAVRDAAAARGVPAERLRVVRSGPGRPPPGEAGAPAGGASPPGDAGALTGGTSPPGEAGAGPPAGGTSRLAGAPVLPAGVASPYVLAVGALEPRKLPDVLVDAHRIARTRGLQAGLVFAGDGPLRPQLAGSQATVLGHVPEPTLEALYDGALAVVCVSRDEGFGFTPIEALARSVPPVVADLPVFDETVAEGALRVPPGDPDALAEALLRLEREPGLREHLVAAGREAIASLSWERAARETRAVLAEAAA